MSYNNSVTINDCITDLQLVEDISNEVDSLEYFISTAKLTADDKAQLQKLLTKFLIKNTKQGAKINKVANKLNKLNYY